MHELTREMCLELIEYITLDAYVEGQPREIYIYYKLLDEPLKDKRSLFKGVFTQCNCSDFKPISVIFSTNKWQTSG